MPLAIKFLGQIVLKSDDVAWNVAGIFLAVQYITLLLSRKTFSLSKEFLV